MTKKIVNINLDDDNLQNNLSTPTINYITPETPVLSRNKARTYKKANRSQSVCIKSQNTAKNSTPKISRKARSQSTSDIKIDLKNFELNKNIFQTPIGHLNMRSKVKLCSVKNKSCLHRETSHQGNPNNPSFILQNTKENEKLIFERNSKRRLPIRSQYTMTKKCLNDVEMKTQDNVKESLFNLKGNKYCPIKAQNRFSRTFMDELDRIEIVSFNELPKINSCLSLVESPIKEKTESHEENFKNLSPIKRISSLRNSLLNKFKNIGQSDKASGSEKKKRFSFSISSIKREKRNSQKIKQKTENAVENEELDVEKYLV